MKRLSLLILAGVSSMVIAMSVMADDYVDDVYYSEETAMEETLKSGKVTPYYNKKQMKEVVFVEDTLSSMQDTTRVVAR